MSEAAVVPLLKWFPDGNQKITYVAVVGMISPFPGFDRLSTAFVDRFVDRPNSVRSDVRSFGPVAAAVGGTASNVPQPPRPNQCAGPMPSCDEAAAPPSGGPS